MPLPTVHVAHERRDRPRIARRAERAEAEERFLALEERRVQLDQSGIADLEEDVLEVPGRLEAFVDDGVEELLRGREPARRELRGDFLGLQDGRERHRGIMTSQIPFASNLLPKNTEPRALHPSPVQRRSVP